MNRNEKKQRSPYERPAMRVVKIEAQRMVCESLPTKDTPTPYQW